MKFFVLLVVLAALFVSCFAAPKNVECGLEHSLNGDGRISCEAYIPNWTFDSAAQECVQFIYGGCGGNANRFETKEVCEERCLN
ncbi:male accessory gland serine protease inhibitor [Drosophila grimshawi]|uniref:GH13181 n=1 Tax=Drosophila grimshawi TaxID=7222 RepID=B4JQI3_DROGR|nr:male accessory gland serine protease inhibitor [Drosophila grimshawi]XP_001997714.1 male accessory gland serine protease inhibitor [Drosophila grimshawi]XP_032595349.1 male accessory gland serine protease inhibitor [Drosophila grimshawi]EDV99163.1 GH13181 [Drosophila grimshawi]EDW04601.1 GH22481 [Drosophila grimshawi]